MSGKILPDRHLIIFDEIQFSHNVLNSLKYFHAKADNYHIAAAGSLLGIKMSSPKFFPVGKVNFRLYFFYRVGQF
ncbi:MAG: AAA family ATPase, partial [Desulfosarcina sp.]|nr:AAA family ATPase [Desulfobacterales bacterium]